MNFPPHTASIEFGFPAILHFCVHVDGGRCVAPVQAVPSALMFAKRAECHIRQKMPVAAVRDCDAAIRLNPDSGKVRAPFAKIESTIDLRGLRDGSVVVGGIHRMSTKHLCNLPYL